MRISSPSAFACVAFMSLAVLSSCQGGKEGKKAPPPAPVTVEKVAIRDFPIRLTASGAVEAFAVVNVKAQIGGILRSIHFNEGQQVKKGDVLFTIDPRPQEAALRQAEANLARSKAQMENARLALRRYSGLVKDNFVSAEKIDQLKAELEAAQAAVSAGEAAVENSRLELEYCVIRSSIDGVAGAHSINQGNVIKPNDDAPLTVIRQVQPIQVTFSLPEKLLGAVRESMAHAPLEAEAAASDGAVSRGTIVFVDNQVDSSTGTIRMKAQFENADRRLWPGQFVTVTLHVGVRHDAVTISSRAVQMGQRGPYVFVVDSQNKAQTRLVEVSGEVDGLVVVEKGLEAGETVVTEGHIKVAPDALVDIRPAPAAAQPAR